MTGRRLDDQPVAPRLGAPPRAKNPPTQNNALNGPFFVFTAATRLNSAENAPLASPHSKILTDMVKKGAATASSHI